MASYLDLLMSQQEEVSEAEGGGGGVWVVADAGGGEVATVTLEAVGAARTLADSLGAYVYGVLLGDGVASLAQFLYQAGADGVRVADHPALAGFALEPYVEILAELFEEEQPEVILFGATPAAAQGRRADRARHLDRSR
jgi:electron transfer flavoprotein alpha subunit